MGYLKYIAAELACEKKWLWGLLFLAFFLRFLALFFFDVSNADGAVRVLLTLDCLKNRGPFPHDDWLPLHFYFIGIVYKLTGDAIWAPRFIGVLFGALTVVPLYLVFKRLFSREIVLLTLFAFSFWGNHIFFGGMPLTETTFIFFMFFSIYFLQRYFEEKALKTLVISSALLFACSWLRYEGWVLAGAMTFAFFVETREFKRTVLFALLNFLPIGLFLYHVYQLTGDPFESLRYADMEAREVLKAGPESWMRVNKTFPYIGVVPLFLLVLWGLRVKERRFFSIVGGLCSLALFVKLFNGSLVPFERYFLAMVIFGLPFFYEAASLFARRFLADRKKVLLVIALFSVAHGTRSFFSSYKEPFSSSFHQSVSFARQNLAGAHIFIDESTDIQPSWLMYSNQRLENVACRASFRVWDDPEVDKKMAEDCLTLDFLEYIVLFPEGRLNKVLEFKEEVEVRFGISFARVYSSGGYEIYQNIGPQNGI